MKHDLTTHPLAEYWPEMTADEYSELLASVKQNGVREPIFLLDGQVLDGRHRYRAAIELGVDCKMRDFPAGHDPTDFVVDRNARRRHLSASSRARAVLLCYEWRDRGHPAEPNPSSEGFSQVTTPQADSAKPPLKDAPAIADPAPAPPPAPVLSATDLADKAGTSVSTVEREKRRMRTEEGDGTPPATPATPTLREQNRDLRQALGESKANAVSLKQTVADQDKQVASLKRAADPAGVRGVSELTDVQKENEGLRARNVELQNRVNALNREVGGLRKRVKELEAEAAE